MSSSEIENRYADVFGAVPDLIRDRVAVAEAVGRIDALETLENFRKAFIDENALGDTTQRLVHFGMTLASADEEVMAMHASSAIRAGASLAHLVGVCETAAVVLGMPAYTRGIRVLAGLAKSGSMEVAL